MARPTRRRPAPAAALATALLATAAIAGCTVGSLASPGNGDRPAEGDASPSADASRPDATAPDTADATPTDPEPISVLVFSRTTGFRHASIEDGVAALQALAGDHGWSVTHTEDAAAFTAENLADYDVVVWLSTTGDVLDASGQAAFEAWVRAGGGYVGVHAAADTEYDWPWYGELVGAWFASHPAIQSATIDVENAAHPATAALPNPWQRTDEWYCYRTNPRPSVSVLLTLDEATYEGGSMGDDHPIAWAHSVDAGRSFYTGLGHTRESYSEPAFLAHLAGAIEWASGR